MQEEGQCEGRETPSGRRQGAGKLRGNLQGENEDSPSRKRGRDRCADKAIQYTRESSMKTPEVLERKCKDFEDIQNRSSNQ